MAYRKHYSTAHRLSPADMDDIIKKLEEKEKKYPEILEKIANIVADEMQQEVLSGKYVGKDGGNPYDGTQKEIIVGKEDIIAKIYSNDAKALFYEMGTGVVGAGSPAVSEYIERYGWKYDNHEHGDAGWWYPTTEDDPNPYKWTDPGGQLRAWTKGLPAMKGFYNASRLVLENIEEITLRELKNNS